MHCRSAWRSRVIGRPSRRRGLMRFLSASRCSLGAVVLAAGASLLAPRELLSQASLKRDGCALPPQVLSADGETGYKKREYGCEGFYVQPQASVNIQVLSLRRGALDLSHRNEVYIAVPPLPDSLAKGLTVFGNSLPAGVNWALDAKPNSDQPLKWSLSSGGDSVRPPATSIGLVARTKPRDGFGTPVWVAVTVAAAKEAAGQTGGTAKTQLVVRIAAAGRIRWRASGGEWFDATDPNGEGRFVCDLPAHLHGHVNIELQWAPRMRPAFSDVETLRLFLW
jgi:hypothetical protein